MNSEKIKNDLKQSKGITLIALIITIVVLLILAGITINGITGDDSILENAGKTAENAEYKSLRDEVSLVLTNREINSSKKTFKEDLLDHFDNDEIEEIGNGLTHVFYVTKNGVSVTVFENGDIENGKVDVWDGRSATVPTLKDDTSKEIHITKCSELRWLANEVNKDEAGTTFAGYTIYLDNNLDFGARQINGEWEIDENEDVKWTPIGIANNANQKFEGIFDGQNHTIKGIYVNYNGNFGGLFGNSYTINNLTIKDSYIKGENAVGGIVGATRNNGSIMNCHNVNTTVKGVSRIGGIIGQLSSVTDNSAQIINCSNTGEIIGTSSWVGGICASLSNKIDKCYNKGIIIGNGENLGGVVGGFPTNSNVVITNCYNIGDVKGIGDGTGTGGILGWVSVSASSAIVQNNYNIGKIIGKNDVDGAIGHKTTDKFQISNNYSLKGSSATNLNSIEKEASEMKTTAFVNTLGNTVWEIVSGKNNGYPVLKWENE